MKTYGVQEVRDRLGVGEHTVLGFIRSGSLRAINVARSTAGRPRWRITAEALAEFELTRESGGPPPAKTRRKKPAGKLIRYY